MRRETARGLLELGWHYPVYQPPKKEGVTVAKEARRALPVEQAMKIIVADDPRPLLVLRECLVCNGTDDALLSRDADNEKTMLLSRWFRCVKLPPDVLQEDAYFHGLFPGKSPCHLFVCSADGSNRIELESDRSRRELWDSMATVIKADYKKDLRKPLKALTKLLDEFDVIDERIDQLEARLTQVIEKDGPNSPKLRKLRKSLEKAEREKAERTEEFAAATELELRRAVSKGQAAVK